MLKIHTFTNYYTYTVDLFKKTFSLKWVCLVFALSKLYVTCIVLCMYIHGMSETY